MKYHPIKSPEPTISEMVSSKASTNQTSHKPSWTSSTLQTAIVAMTMEATEEATNEEEEEEGKEVTIMTPTDPTRKLAGTQSTTRTSHENLISHLRNTKM